MTAPFDRGRARPGLDVSPERWVDVSRVFSEAVDRGPSDREAYLAEACSDDPALRAAVDSLLAAHDSAGSFGDTPLLAGTSPRRLVPGSELGPFRVESLVGAGGMGEVYRAYDTKLRRTVALKVLPDTFAADPDRRIRFEEEAHALAALNHPNIGAIYGIEDSGEIAALVLELVEGVTLAERLVEGPLPIDEVVRIAQQLAQGLEAAHERGIVHRDFKPSNIKITPDGTVKILDFGLAKTDASAPGNTRLPAPFDSSSPVRDATAAGVLVGTAAYMSPEQAKGGRTDKRTDIWAFGCVLFEMCASGPPFAGATVSEILTAIAEREPEWTLLRPGTPLSVNRLLRRCLTKDPKLRLRDIGEARLMLTPGHDLQDLVRPSAPPTRLFIMTLIASLVLGAFMTWLYVRPAAPDPVEFTIVPPNDAQFPLHPGRTPFALSPDGKRIAYIVSEAPAGASEGSSLVWLRAMQNHEALPLEGTKGATAIFWSPDSLSLAFIADDKLNRIDIPLNGPDGPVVPICGVTQASFVHGTWGGAGAGQILLGRGNGTAIELVLLGDSSKRPIVAADPTKGEARVHWPSFLPDGDRFLYTARLANGEGELRVAGLDGSSRFITHLSSNAQWVPPNLVVFAREGVLMGQRVDVDAARPLGDPFPIVEQVEYNWTTSRAMFSTALNGTIAWQSIDRLGQQVVAVDPSGKGETPIGPPASYGPGGALSPDDSALLTSRIQPEYGTTNIWRHDLVRGTADPITTGRGTETAPIWADEGRGMFFARDTAGTVTQLFHMNLATGVETRLLPPSDSQQNPMDILPDGSIIYGTQQRFFKLPMNPRGTPVAVQTLAGAWGLKLSPDGRTVAMIGDGKVYVGRLDGSEATLVVAEDVRAPAKWNRTGDEFYFVNRNDVVMSVSVRTAPRLVLGVPRPLFKVKRGTALLDVFKDRRLLLRVPQADPNARPIVIRTGGIRPKSE